jgi:hypothetical protein
MNREQFQAEVLRVADDVEKLVRDYFETTVQERAEVHGDETLLAFAIGAVTSVLPIVIATGMTRDMIVRILDDSLAKLVEAGLLAKA